MRVLFIDDYADTADILAEVAVMMGHECAVAYSGTGRVNAATIFKPDVIFLDVRLGAEDGVCICRALRHKKEHSDWKIVAVTGTSNLAERSENGFFDAVLMKPLSIESLEKWVAVQTGRRRFVRYLNEAESPSSKQTADLNL